MNNMYFKKGDLVEVIDIDENDRMYGIKIGDIFVIDEEDSPVPMCTPLNSNCTKIKYSFIHKQIKRI